MSITTDQVLHNILRIILTGRRQSRIENNLSITEYFDGSYFAFKVSQIQTVEIQQKFENPRTAFEENFNIQLIIKKEKFLNFYIGEEIVLEKSTELSQINVNLETKNKLMVILGESKPSIYVIV